MKILLIIPAYNEELNIDRVVNEVKNVCPHYDYVIINDGSKDDTAGVCRRNGYNMIDLPVNLGLSGAFQTGVRYAIEMGYEGVIQLDGDGQHNPIYIDSIVKELSDGADIVIGSRFLENYRISSMRNFGNSIISACIKITTRKKIFDTTSGLRAYNYRVMKEYADNMNYYPEPDTISYLIRRGFVVKEVPVEMREREAGESYLTLRRSIEYMLKMCLSILLIQAFREK